MVHTDIEHIGVPWIQDNFSGSGLRIIRKAAGELCPRFAAVGGFEKATVAGVAPQVPGTGGIGNVWIVWM